MLLQTLTPLAELAVPAALAIMPVYPTLTPPSIPIQAQFLTLGLRTSLLIGSVRKCWEFPGSPAVRTRHFHCGSPGSILGRGTKIPQAVQHGQKNKTKQNPVLLSGAQGLGLESPSKTQQGTQFGPGATSGTGLFSLRHLSHGGPKWK